MACCRLLVQGLTLTKAGLRIEAASQWNRGIWACGGLKPEGLHLTEAGLKIEAVSQGIRGIWAGGRLKVEGLHLGKGSCQEGHAAVEDLATHLQRLRGHGVLGSRHSNSRLACLLSSRLRSQPVGMPLLGHEVPTVPCC